MDFSQYVQSQIAQDTPNQNNDYVFDNPFLQHLQAGIEGAAHGATMGLNNHLSALMGATGEQISQAYNQYKNSINPGSAPNTNIPFSKSFTDYLAAARARQSDIQKQNPLSYLGGDIAGSIYTGARALPAASNQILPNAVNTFAKGVPAMAAQQAIQGGVNNYFASPDTDLSSAAKQAGISAALAGAIGTGTNYVAPWIGNQARILMQKTGINSNINKLSSLLGDAASSVSATARQSKDTIKDIFGMKDWEGAKQAATDYRDASVEALNPKAGTQSPPPPQSSPPPKPTINPSSTNTTYDDQSTMVRHQTDPNAFVRVQTKNWMGKDLSIPEVSDVFSGNLPKGAGSDMLAVGLKDSGVNIGDQFKMTGILNPATVEAFNSGAAPESTLMGKMGINAIRKMGGEPGDISWDNGNGKVNMLFNTKELPPPPPEPPSQQEMMNNIASIYSGKTGQKLRNAPDPNPSGTTPMSSLLNVFNPSGHPLGYIIGSYNLASDPGDFTDRLKSAGLGYLEGLGLEYTGKGAAFAMTRPGIMNILKPNDFYSGIGTGLNTGVPAAQRYLSGSDNSNNLDFSQYNESQIQNQPSPIDFSQYKESQIQNQ